MFYKIVLNDAEKLVLEKALTAYERNIERVKQSPDYQQNSNRLKMIEDIQKTVKQLNYRIMTGEGFTI